MKKATNKKGSERNSDGFPKTVKSGAASVTVYRRLLSPKPGADGEQGTRYAQFTIYYQLSGREYRLYRNTEKAAMSLAREKALEIERGHVSSLTLLGSEMEAYLAAKELVVAEGLTLEAAVRDYMAAYRLVKPVSLVQIARQYQLHATKIVDPKTIEQIIPDFHEARKEKADRHKATLKNDLARFAKKFSGRLIDVNAAEIDAWLSGLRVTDRAGCQKPGDTLVGERTRRNIYGSVANLFHWAQRKNYLPRERPTEIDYVDKPGKPPHAPQSFNAAEIRKLLEAVPARLVPLIGLCAFGGVRRAEIERLDWEDVRWDHLDIQIWADNAKTNARRLPPLLPVLQEWLEPFRGLKGPVCPNPDRFNQLTAKAKSLGLSWAHDILRDSFISNRAAVIQDLVKVAYEAGNSKRVIEESYLKRVSLRDATEFFAATPKPGWSAAGLEKMKGDALRSGLAKPS